MATASRIGNRACWCCCEPYGTGCVIGPRCQCTFEECHKCRRCLIHCVCPALSPERETAELEAAGWIKVSRFMWQSPSGGLYMGPHGAWRYMKERIK